MNIILFNVQGRINKKIEVYNYEAISEKLRGKIIEEITKFEEKYIEYEVVEYNPVIEYKDKLSRITIDQVESESATFKVINSFLRTGELIENDEVVIENNSQEKDLPFQVSFYVIVHNEKYYFRKHM